MVLEQRGGKWNRMSFETLAAGAAVRRAKLDLPVCAAVPGQAGISGADARRKQLEKVYAVSTSC